MREFDFKQIRKMRLGKKFHLNPFPGRYPTRVLVATPSYKIGIMDNQTDWKAHVEQKGILYLGKPDPLTLRKLFDIKRFRLFIEFDKKNLVYMALFNGTLSECTAPSFGFYHAYVRGDGRKAWTWFLDSWHVVKVGKYTTYSTFPIETDKNLSIELAALLEDRTKLNVNF